MAPRRKSTRRRKLQTDKNAEKNKDATTPAPTIASTVAATASPTPVPIQVSTAAPTVTATNPPVIPTTLSPTLTVTATAPPVLPTTFAPTVSVTGTQPPVIPTTQAPTAAITGTQPPVLPSTLAPTISVTATPTTLPVTTPSPTVAATTNATLAPTVAGTDPFAVPTLAPTFSLDSVVQSFHLEFSTWTDSTLTMKEQKVSLQEILNVAMCSNGVQLITRNMTDACPPGVWQDIGEPTMIWNQPVAYATLLDTSYWRWNFTYSVLDVGYQTQDSLQGMLNDSITSGRMDETLELEWDAPSRAKVVGTERTIITGIPQRSADILRIIGIALAVLTVLVVWLLTRLARQHRHRKDAKTVQIVFSSSSMEGGADDNLEEMLSQSREIALQQKPTIPPSLLPAVSSDDDDVEDDIALGVDADHVN